jgi:predicted metal-dependent hydrolase
LGLTAAERIGTTTDRSADEQMPRKSSRTPDRTEHNRPVLWPPLYELPGTTGSAILSDGPNTVICMGEYPVDIIRSARRKKTISASLRDGRIRVMVPDGLDRSEESRLVDEVVARVLRKATSNEIDLPTRAEELSTRYGLPAPAEIEWSDRQTQRWGSCTPGEGRIRISSRMASMPVWVLDMVLIHEMAHLEVADHGPRFRELVDRYELAERATGYLIAVTGHADIDE